MKSKLDNLSIVFPIYKDELTVESLVFKCIKLCEQLDIKSWEIVIVNDGSPDQAGVICDRLASQFNQIKVIHHAKNLGYGEAIKTGLKFASYENILQTDGDDEYDIFDFYKFLKVMHNYDLIITFRYKKLYSNSRIFISHLYNVLVRFLFRTKYRDISTGLRFLKKSVIDDFELISQSPFIGAEIVLRSMYAGYSIGEVGIQTYPRTFGSGSSTSMKNIFHTIKDLFLIRKQIFSDNYMNAIGRNRP